MIRHCRDGGKLKISILKNRSGQTGNLELHFAPEYDWVGEELSRLQTLQINDWVSQQDE